MLRPDGLHVHGLDELGVTLPEPVEDALTFEGNARIKAQGYARALGRVCLADDSGLEVAGLGGAPGVRSARYAGATGTRAERDRANNRKLLAELALRGDADRSARLVCALCLVDAVGSVLFEARGEWPGRIVDEPRGDHGFGYDTHLFLVELGKTAAELHGPELHARSHRGRAVRALLDWLEQQRAQSPDSA